MRYERLDRIKLAAMMITALSLGIGAIAWLLLWLLMRHTRLHRHDCPNCGTRMKRVDEVHDNDYLTPAQDMEEKSIRLTMTCGFAPNAMRPTSYPMRTSARATPRAPIVEHEPMHWSPTVFSLNPPPVMKAVDYAYTVVATVVTPPMSPMQLPR